MLIRGETSYYLPLGYLVEQHRGLLVLRRPNGSVADTFDERQAIGEIVERRAWEDSIDRDGGRLERFLELPGPIVLGILWLLGIVPIGLCAVVLLHLRTLLLTVAGG
jgi:hypothetical protein